MDFSLLVPAVMTLLEPFLKKAGEKAAETIGEKLAKEATEKDIWHKVKTLFIKGEEPQAILKIENKPVATPQDVELIQNKLTTAVNTNPNFVADIQASFNLTSSNMFFAELLLKSIAADKLKLTELVDEKRDSSVDAEGGYEVMIKRTRRRMEKDEKDFIKLVTGK